MPRYNVPLFLLILSVITVLFLPVFTAGNDECLIAVICRYQFDLNTGLYLMPVFVRKMLFKLL